MTEFRLPPQATTPVPRTGVEADLHNYRRALHSMLFLVGTSEEEDRKPSAKALETHRKMLKEDKRENGHYNDRPLQEVAFVHFPANPGRLLGLLQAADIVTDIGAGISTLGEETVAIYPGKRFVAIDIDPTVTQQKLPDDCKIVADATNMPEIDDGTSDLTIATYSLPYWATSPDEARRSIAEMFRITKVGGLILINAVFSYVPEKTTTIIEHAFSNTPMSGLDAVTMHHDMLVLDALSALRESRCARVRYSFAPAGRVNTSIRKLAN